MSEFDPYYKWLGIPPEEQPADYYRLLGLRVFESDLDVISSAADRQMSHVRSFQHGRHAQHSQRLLSELSAAKLCLLSPEKKAAYDAQLKAEQEEAARQATAQQAAATPESFAAPPDSGTEDLGPQAPMIWTPPAAVGAVSEEAPAPPNWTWRAVVGSVCVGLVIVLLTWKWMQEDGDEPGPTTDGKTAKSSPETAAKTKTPQPKTIPDKLIDGEDVQLPIFNGARDLLTALDVEQQAVKGDWTLEVGGVLVSPVNQAYATMRLPGEIPQEYVVALIAERTERYGALTLGLPIAGANFTVTLDGHRGRLKLSGLGLLDKRQYYDDKNATRRIGNVFRNGRAQAVICRVRNGRVTVICGGRTIIDYPLDAAARLSMPHQWKIYDYPGLFIGTNNTCYHISRLVIAPLPPERQASSEKEPPDKEPPKKEPATVSPP